VMGRKMEAKKYEKQVEGGIGRGRGTNVDKGREGKQSRKIPTRRAKNGKLQAACEGKEVKRATEQ